MNQIMGMEQEGLPRLAMDVFLEATTLLESALSWDFNSPRAGVSRPLLIRPPAEWRSHVLSAAFLRSLLDFHRKTQGSEHPASRGTRQLFVTYCSLTGPVLPPGEKGAFCAFWMEALLATTAGREETADACAAVLRLILNFGLGEMSARPQFEPLLGRMREIALGALRESAK